MRGWEDIVISDLDAYLIQEFCTYVNDEVLLCKECLQIMFMPYSLCSVMPTRSPMDYTKWFDCR